MRRLLTLSLIFYMGLLFSRSAAAAEFKKTNGDVLKGEVASANDDGIVVRQDIGGFTPRVPWGSLTQETLKELMESPQAKKFVEPYIEIPIEEKVERKKKEKKPVIVKEPTRVPLPAKKQGFFAALAGSAPGLGVLGLLYAANLYAAFAIAQYRRRSVAAVVGLSAIVPVVGPILFLAIPSAAHVHAEPTEQPQATVEPVAPIEKGGAQSSLSVAGNAPAKPAAAAANPNYTTVFAKSNTNFDRRFFELKFSGFFRIVPAEPEKSLVIAIKTHKAEYLGIRISRISTNELHMQLQRNNVEVGIPFSDIMEVQVKPKDAK